MSLTVEELRDKVFAKAEANGADPMGVVESQLNTLNTLFKSTVDALGGDARVQTHLEAQLALGKFSSEAEAFVEGHIWWGAFKDVLFELAAVASDIAVAAIAKGLAEAMGGGFRD
jgi:hypothetical protein